MAVRGAAALPTTGAALLSEARGLYCCDTRQDPWNLHNPLPLNTLRCLGDRL